MSGLGRTLGIAGILTASLGFLTGSPLAGPLEDALDCLDSLDQERAAREANLARAESLGVRIEALRTAGEEVPGDLLRQAERLEQEALDREVELLSDRERCRRLSREALESTRDRIDLLQAGLARGDLSSAEAAELLDLQEARTRLQAALEEPMALGYVLLPADPSDTEETLEAKLQYYEDVQGYLHGLSGRIAERRDEVADERRTLVEAQRFLEDMSFLDEGGRISPGGLVRLPGAGGIEGEEFARSAGGAGELGLGQEEMEFLMAQSPSSPEESDQLLALLERIRQRIESELEAVSRETERIRARLAPEAPGPQ